jgi:SAM-dependent methyltransferase
MAASWIRWFGIWRRGGVVLVARVAWDRMSDRVLEHRAGIRSVGLVPIESLLAHWTDCHDYFPSSFRALKRVLDDLDIQAVDVFVDYGCGMGRALVLAARMPFSRLYGVEVSERLLDVARRNLQAALAPSRLADVTLVAGNALNFRLPAAASVLYFYNPFHGGILSAVMADIERSLHESPRPLRIVFNNPAHFRKVEGQYPWLRAAQVYDFEYPIVVYEADVAGPLLAA